MAKKPLWEMALFLKSPNSDNKLAFIVLMAFQEGDGWSGFVHSAEQACELCWVFPRDKKCVGITFLYLQIDQTSH